MTVENDTRNDNHMTLKGLTGLAECEIKFVDAAEKAGKEGYRPKVARLVNDLERISNVADENNLELSEDLEKIISDLIISHPDRNKIIWADIPDHRSDQSLNRKSR